MPVKKKSGNVLNAPRIISKMFSNHMYNYLTMCKQIDDVGLKYWCCETAVLGAI